jgi:hypothetical protein
MQTKVHWYVRAYHAFMVYLPVILLFAFIFLVYGAYYFTYLAHLLQGEINENVYPFFHTSTSKTAYTKGLVLLILVSTLLIILLICLFRAVFMNPGYFPSPLNLESKIIMKNSLNHQLLNRSPVNSEKIKGQNNKYERLPEEDDQIKKNKDTFKFLSNFSHYILEGPLTFQENVKIRKSLGNFFSDSSAPQEAERRRREHEDILYLNNPNQSRESDSTDDDFFDKFKGVDLSKAVLCGTCLRWKVERSHHCRQCGRCVLKMDHHCPWLANCVGFRNYKFFCLLHLYGIIATTIIALTYWEALLNTNLRHDTDLGEVFFVFFVYICNLGLFGFLLWLFLVNWRLVLTGQTVIENADRERFPSTKSINIYDLGKLKNFKVVFGNNPLVWFLPFFPNYTGEGLIYETNNLRR